MNCLLLLSLLLLELPVSVIAYYSISDSESFLALGSAILNSSSTETYIQSIATSGVDLNAGSCYASIGGGSFVNALEQERVKGEADMCLHLSRFPASAQNELPDVVVTAMSEEQQQASLLELEYKSSSDLSLSKITDLPNGYFPAVVSTDEQDGIYVALHQTNGQGIDQAAANRLISFRSYQRQFVYPNHNVPPMYSPTVYKYNRILKEERWQTLFNTTYGKTFITGMATVPSGNKLVVIGSTTGHGMSLGAMAKSNGDWDGFITLVNRDTGVIDTSSFATPNHNLFSTRIASQFDKDDMVLGLCMDDEKAYVVGWTEGKMEGGKAGGAFVLKFDIDTLDIIWKRQIADDGEGVEAKYCAVVDDIVYVGGEVPSHLWLEEHRKPVFGQALTVDLFVASYDSKTGELNFIRQIDSLRNDYMVGLEIAETKDVYVTANAYNAKEGIAHTYVLSVDTQGNHEFQNQLELGLDPITGETLNQDDEAIDPLIVAAIMVPSILFLAMAIYWTSFSRGGNLKLTKEPAVEMTQENDDAELQPAPPIV